MAFQTFTLTGTYHLFDGTACRGSVIIIPSVKNVKDTTGNVILAGRLKVDLEPDVGSFSVVLPNPNDTTIAPSGFGYTVAVKLSDAQIRIPVISFGANQITGPTLDMENVTPVDVSSLIPTVQYATAPDLANAIAGAVATAEAYTDSHVPSIADGTTSAKGIVQLATSGQAVTGTATDLVVTPAGLRAAVDAVLNGAPTALDTLKELADAINDDASFAATVTTALGTKVNSSTYTAGLAGKAAYPTGGTDGQALVKAGTGTAWATIGGLTPTAVQTADYTAVAGDLVQASAASGTRTITLPASAPLGSVVAIKKTDSSTNLVNVLPSSGDTIEGVASVNWGTQNVARRFVKDAGANWIIDANYLPSGSGGVTLAANQPLNLANYQSGDGDQAAFNRLMTVWLAMSSKPEVFIPRGSYSFQSSIVMYSGLTLTGEGGAGSPLGTLVTITNKTTAMFDWPAGQNLVKGFNARGISFSGQPTRAATMSYVVPVFASTTKTLQYSNFAGCQFQFFTTFHCFFGGGTIRDCNFAHFNDIPLWLTGYDWTVDTNFLGVDVSSTVGKFYTTPSLSASATGGSLSNGTIYVQTTAVTPIGESDVTYQATSGTVSASITLAGGTSTQSVSLTTLSGGALPDGTTGWNIYVSATGTAGTFYRVNGGTPVANGATYTITTAPGSGTVPAPWVFPTTSPLVKVENCPNFTLRDAFPTITSGGPGLHVLNCIDGGYVDSFKADGYNTANTAQYGINGAGILVEGSNGITIFGPRIHRAMGTAQDQGAITFKNSAHCAVVGPLYKHLPTGAATVGFAGTCSDITMAGAVYDEAGTANKGIRSDAVGATVTDFKWDEVPATGTPGPVMYSPPAAWSSSTTYTYGSTAPYASVTRNGSWYGLVATSTNNDPASDGGAHWVLLAQAGTGSVFNYGGALGDGSHGAINLDGTNTYVSLMSKSGNVYTLNTDILPSSLTVAAGVTLKPNSYLIQCTGTVTNNGTIDNSGGNGTAAGVAGAQAGSGSSYVVGGAGGAGNTGAGTAGSSGAFSGVAGGGGGIGSAGASGAAGAIPSGSLNRIHGALSLIVGQTGNAGATRYIGGGSGGGGGGGDGTNKGGGGGGGGGAIIIIAQAIVNSGTITANGGNGGTPTTGNAAGGGAGGGGLIALASITALSGAGTRVANSGTSGSGVGTGTAGTAPAANGNQIILTLV